MADEPGDNFVMPPLSLRQREILLRLRFDRDERGREFSAGSIHGTLRNNLLDKGLVAPLVEGGPRWQSCLTEFGRWVAEQVQEQDIRRGGARLAADASRTLRQADADMRTPPSARPGYQAEPVASRSTIAIYERAGGLKRVLAWLDDPSRRTRIEQLKRCGHGSSCTNCRELEVMRHELERALIMLTGEIDELKRQLGLSELNERRARAAAQGLIRAQAHLLDAVRASVGVEPEVEAGDKKAGP